MAHISPFIGNCGMRVLYGLTLDLDRQVRDVHNILRGDYRIGLIAFTDAVNRKAGTKFAALIRKEKLGKLHSCTRVRNPNTGRQIQGWYWAPDRDAVAAWIARNPAQDLVGRDITGR